MDEREAIERARQNGTPPTLNCFVCGAPVTRPRDVVVDEQGAATGYGVCTHHREEGGAAVLFNLLDEARAALRAIATAQEVPVEATTGEAYRILRDRAAQSVPPH